MSSGWKCTPEVLLDPGSEVLIGNLDLKPSGMCRANSRHLHGYQYLTLSLRNLPLPRLRSSTTYSYHSPLTTYHLLRITYFLLCTTYNLQRFTYHLLLTLYYLLLTTDYVRLATHCLLLTTHYSLLTTYY